MMRLECESETQCLTRAASSRAVIVIQTYELGEARTGTTYSRRGCISLAVGRVSVQGSPSQQSVDGLTLPSRPALPVSW